MGNISPSFHWRGKVYDINGLSPPLTMNDFKDPIKIITPKKEDNEV